MTVRVVVDSAAGLSEELLRELDIAVVDLHVLDGDEGASTSTDAQKAPATTPWKSIGIVAGVAVLALVALALSLGSRGTPPRHRRRR